MDDYDFLRILPGILERRAAHRTSVLPSAAMTMTREQVEHGLGDGTLVRGVTERKAEGTRGAPSQGQLLLPEDVDKVWPAVTKREVVGYLVVGKVDAWSAAVTRWRAPVVAVGRA